MVLVFNEAGEPDPTISSERWQNMELRAFWLQLVDWPIHFEEGRPVTLGQIWKELARRLDKKYYFTFELLVHLYFTFELLVHLQEFKSYSNFIQNEEEVAFYASITNPGERWVFLKTDSHPGVGDALLF